MSDKQHQVFISYSTIDSETAFALLRVLESNGLNCWIAPRDIPQGAQWADEIDKAIQSARIFVVIVSTNSIDSKQVPKEIALAVSSCEGVFPFRIDRTALQGSFRYYLSDYQFVDAIQEREKKMQELANSIRSALGMEPYVPPVEEATAAPLRTPEAAPAPVSSSVPIAEKPAEKKAPSDKPKKKKLLPLLLAAAGLLIVVGIILAVVLSGNPSETQSAMLKNNQSAESNLTPSQSCTEPNPLSGRWKLICTENRGSKELRLRLNDSSVDEFVVCADGFVYGYRMDYFKTVESGHPKLTWSGNAVNFEDVFQPSDTSDDYTLSSTCFFLDSFDGTAPTQEGDTHAPAYSARDFSSTDLSSLTQQDCYPDRYFAVHMKGSYQESPVSVLTVDTWFVFQYCYPILYYTAQPTLVGDWEDNRGNAWRFWAENSDIKFTLTDASGTVYQGSFISSDSGNSEEGDFFERVTFSFKGFSMRNYALFYFDGMQLCFIDDQGLLFTLTRK